jgi:hypothetical protein
MTIDVPRTPGRGRATAGRSTSWPRGEVRRLRGGGEVLHAETTGRREMGAIHVHEFMSLDGVIDAPTWTFDYGFDPQMGEAIGAVTERCRGILLGRTTYEMFEPAWSTRTVEDDPGAPFFNDTTKYVVSATLTTATWRNSKIIGPYDPDAIRSLSFQLQPPLATGTSNGVFCVRPP